MSRKSPTSTAAKAAIAKLKHQFTLKTAEAEKLTGDIQDRLKIGKQIGRGAYAFVYKATFDGEVVAVKVLLPGYMEENGPGMQMFIREGQYMSRMKHRYVDTFVDFHPGYSFGTQLCTYLSPPAIGTLCPPKGSASFLATSQAWTRCMQGCPLHGPSLWSTFKEAHSRGYWVGSS
jgi:serine/threonine protein kinase